MFRSAILAAFRNSSVEHLITTAPLASQIVARYVAGPERADALRVSRELVDQGLAVTLGRLGEETTEEAQALAVTEAYRGLLGALAEAGLVPAAEVSLKLTAVGQRLDPTFALENARSICQAAAAAGTTVTLDMEDHTTTDASLDTLAELRRDYPSTGVALQAYLRRTGTDCEELARAGSRVRLCKGAYAEPESVGFENAFDVDRSFVRCLNVLLAGDGYPMVATHDPRLIRIAEERARWYDRTPETFEFQMLFGVRPDEQRRLVGEGYTMRVYVPYGREWYAYLTRRLAERPANLALFLRSLASTR